MDLQTDNRTNGVAVVRLQGRLDLMSASLTKEYVAGVVNAGQKRIVFDLNEVSFIDSSGLGALLSGLKTARVAGGDLRIARPGEQAKIILELTTLNRVLKPYVTVEEALHDW